jgi:hypothetical protein
MQSFLDDWLHTSVNVKIAYRIYVILIANKELIKKKLYIQRGGVNQRIFFSLSPILLLLVVK